jgi:meiosis induction protein kinase IME2/SME1
LTSLDCLEHPYILEASRFRSHVPPALSVSTSLSGHSTGLSTPVSQFTSSPRVAQRPSSHLSSHLAGIFETSSSHRQSFFPPPDSTDPQYANFTFPKHHYPPPLQHSTTQSSASSYPSAEPSPNLQSDWESMQTSPPNDIHEEYALAGQPMDTATSPMALEFPARPPADADVVLNAEPNDAAKLHKTPSIPPRKQRWGFGGMFGHGDKSHLPAVNESHIVAQNRSNPSLKRTQSPSTDSRSLPEASSPIAAAPPPKDPKKVKKEAARMAREAEMERRAQMKKAQQEQSRAVMQNRNLILMESQTKQDLAWKWQSHAHLLNSQDTSRLAGSTHNKLRNGGPIRDRPVHGNAALGVAPYERVAKARKREFDDDHSMSSADVRSSAVVSVMSFATHDSDPGPSMRTQPGLFNSIREISTSSPLSHLDDFSVSGASDQSHSQHLTQPSVDSSSLSDLGSPPPIHTLSLSPARSWGTLPKGGDSADEGLQHPRPSRLVVPSPTNESPYGGHLNGLSPSPGLTAPKSAINPIFRVVSPLFSV